MHMPYLSGLVRIPQSGPAFYTFAGEKSVATILLAPGEGLSKKWRRFAEKHEIISCAVRADFESAPPPEAFHQITLRWAIYSADCITIWSAPFPQFARDFRQDGFQAVENGARFLTTIETNELRAPEWAASIQRWKRKATHVRIYGPEIVGGLQ
jgi:hypothetical protein